MAAISPEFRLHRRLPRPVLSEDGASDAIVCADAIFSLRRDLENNSCARFYAASFALVGRDLGTGKHICKSKIVGPKGGEETHISFAGHKVRFRCVSLGEFAMTLPRFCNCQKSTLRKIV